MYYRRDRLSPLLLPSSHLLALPKLANLKCLEYLEDSGRVENGEKPGTKVQGLGISWGKGSGGQMVLGAYCMQRDDGSFTIEKVTLAFQDLGHLLDPGLTDCRV